MPKVILRLGLDYLQADAIANVDYHRREQVCSGVRPWLRRNDRHAGDILSDLCRPGIQMQTLGFFGT
jgi:hypothetical protein